LEVGAQFDRFGGYHDEHGVFQDKGTFIAPYGSSYEGRALPDGTHLKPLKGYEVIKPIPVKEGPAIPWFGKEGGGIQHELPMSINDLLAGGYIKPIDAPSIELPGAKKTTGNEETNTTPKKEETTTPIKDENVTPKVEENGSGNKENKSPKANEETTNKSELDAFSEQVTEPQINEVKGGDPNRNVGGRGRRHGQRLRKNELATITENLKQKFGLDVQVGSESATFDITGFTKGDGTPFQMPDSAQAIFITDGKTSKIVIREGATLYEIYHEFMHFKHSQELGVDQYLKLGGKGTTGELAKEQYVFDKIVQSKEKFTREELEHALRYINDVRNKFGKAPLVYDFSDIPSVRKESKPTKIIK
jgi:hypothetical protein